MQKIRGLAKVTASVSLACGIAAAAAGPALAASPNEAYAAQACAPRMRTICASLTISGRVPMTTAICGKPRSDGMDYPFAGTGKSLASRLPRAAYRLPNA